MGGELGLCSCVLIAGYCWLLLWCPHMWTQVVLGWGVWGALCCAIVHLHI